MIKHPLMMMLMMLAVSLPCSAQQIEREPIDRHLPDEVLLELLEELDLAELRAEYDRLHAGVEVEVSEQRLRELEQELSRLQRRLDDAGQRRDALHKIEETQQEIRNLCRSLAMTTTDTRLRMELLARLAEINISLLHGVEAPLLQVQAGMPGASLRTEASSLASEALAAAAQALALIEDVLYELEDDPALADDAVARQDRRRLVEDWRGRRLPLLLAVAASAQSLATDDRQAALRAIAAFDTLPADYTLTISAQLAQSTALLKAGRLSQAQRGFAALLSSEKPLHAAEQLSATFGLARAHAQARDFTQAHAALDSLERSNLLYGPDAPALWRLLLADCRTRIDLEHARSLQPSAAADAVLLRATRPYENLLSRSGELQLPREVLLSLILDRLCASELLRDIPQASLPTLALLAHARLHLQEHTTFAEGAELLAAALRRSDLDAEGAGRVLEEALHRLAGEPAAATVSRLAHMTLDLAPKLADEAEAARLLTLAWQALAAQSRDENEADSRLRESLLGALIDAAPPARVNTWRLQLAQLQQRTGQTDEAVRTLLNVEAHDASYAQARVLLAQARYQQWRAAKGTPQERALARELLEAARHAQQALAEPGHDTAVQSASDDDLRRSMLLRAHLYQAEALAALDEGQSALDALALIDARRSDQPDLIVWRLRLEAQLLTRLGRFAEAASLIERLLAMHPEQGGAGVENILEQMLAEFDSGHTPGSNQEAPKRVREELLPLTRDLLSWAQRNEPARLETHQLRLARVLVLAEEAQQALSLLDQIHTADPRAAAQLRYIISRADACFLLDRDEEAFRLYSTLIQGLEASGTYDGHYWAATLRRLLILERQGRIEQIQPRLRQLRQLDESFGGEPFYSEFQALQHRLLDHD